MQDLIPDDARVCELLTSADCLGSKTSGPGEVTESVYPFHYLPNRDDFTPWNTGSHEDIKKALGNI